MLAAFKTFLKTFAEEVSEKAKHISVEYQMQMVKLYFYAMFFYFNQLPCIFVSGSKYQFLA